MTILKKINNHSFLTGSPEIGEKSSIRFERAIYERIMSFHKTKPIENWFQKNHYF